MTFPFVFVGQGPGKPGGYAFYTYVLFEEEPSEEVRAQIEKGLPEAVSAFVRWWGRLLAVGDSDIGFSVKFEYEPDWYGKVDELRATNTHLELWTKPGKKSWERFHHVFDRWVVGLHSIQPIEVCLKDHRIPKSRRTAWNRWSAVQPLDALSAALVPLIDAGDDRGDESRVVNPAMCLGHAVAERIAAGGALEDLGRELSLEMMRAFESANLPWAEPYGALFASLSTEEMTQELRRLASAPVPLFALMLARHDLASTLLFDASMRSDIWTVLATLTQRGENIPEWFCNLADSVTHCRRVLLAGPVAREAMKPKDRDQALLAAALLLYSIELGERVGCQPFWGYQQRYSDAAALFYLLGEFEQGAAVAARGTERFGADPAFGGQVERFVRGFDDERFTNWWSG